MELSIPGLIGAAIGLALGYVDWRVFGGFVEARLRKLDRSSGPAEREAFEGKLRILRGVLFVATVMAFPVIGFLLGLAIAGRGMNGCAALRRREMERWVSVRLPTRSC